jgi:hypothetical protein
MTLAMAASCQCEGSRREGIRGQVSLFQGTEEALCQWRHLDVPLLPPLACGEA